MTITILPNTFYHYALKLQHLLLMYTLYILKSKEPGICCQVLYRIIPHLGLCGYFPEKTSFDGPTMQWP